MAYSEQLAERVRDVLAGERAREQKWIAEALAFTRTLPPKQPKRS